MATTIALRCNNSDDKERGDWPEDETGDAELDLLDSDELDAE
jgi:hypothetical protein